jgi:poly-gamma-glutamate synthesis protein (capsule biosynthesis protein)
MSTQTFANGFIPIRKTAKKENCIELLFTGDFCPREKTEQLVMQGKSKNILEEFKPILKDCDLSISNLETPLTTANTAILKSGPNLKVNPKCMDLLKEAKFDVTLLANNHIGDFGTKPVIETIELLKKNKMKFVGAGKDLEDARKPLFIRKKGIKIAFLNYAENEFGTADDKKPGASTLDPLVNIGQIKSVSQKSDVTIVVIHGGNERNPIPSPRMKKTYRAFADAGASAVIAMHTHCPQGIEVWNGVPIVYSMGNFLFDWTFTREGLKPDNFWWTGYAVKITFDKKSAISLEVIPHTCAPNATKLHVFDAKSKKQFFKYLAKISEILIDEKESQKYWEAWSAQNAPIHTRFLKEPSLPLKDEEQMKELLPLRNVFTCEAHNENMTTLLRLIEENKLEKAKSFYHNIEKLQKADFDIIKKIAKSQ